MKTCLKPLLGSLLAFGLVGAANAAYFERVDYLAVGGYSAATGTQLSSDAAADLSPDASTIALFGAQSFSTVLANGVLDHSYAADTTLTVANTSTSMSMSLSHSLEATASGALTVGSHQQDAFIDLSAVTLRVVGDPGQAIGSVVQVSFAGTAGALLDNASVVSGGVLGLGLSVSRGDDVLGEYLWDVAASGDQLVNFSFGSKVGDELTLSAYMYSGASLSEAVFAQDVSPYALVNTGANLAGEFSITAVPEPEGYAMLLAGLVAVGALVRRKNQVG